MTESPRPASLAAPPGPGALGLLALLVRHRFRRTVVLRRLFERYGEIVSFRLLGHRFVVTSSLEIARDVLIRRHAEFGKGLAYARLRRAIGDGMISADGDEHLEQRLQIQSCFRPAEIRRHDRAWNAAADRLLARWKAGEAIDLVDEMNRYAIDALTTSLFHVDASPDLDLLTRAVREVLVPVEKLHRAVLPFGEWLDRVPTPANLSFRRARAALDRVLFRWIDDRLSVAAEERPDDVLTRLVATGGESGRRAARDRLLTLLVAGAETTASSLAATFLTLARHPAELAKLRQEVDDALGKGPVTAADFERLPRVRAVLRETLRLYSPVASISRRPLRTLELGGYRVEPRDSIGISPRLLQRDPRHFPEPDRFWPDRWRDGSGAADEQAFLSFGLGRRRCIGERLALDEMALLVARVVREWSVEVPASALFDYDGAVTDRAGNRLVAIPRRRGEGGG